MRQCREQQVSLPQVAPSYSTRSVPSPGSLLPAPPSRCAAAPNLRTPGSSYLPVTWPGLLSTVPWRAGGILNGICSRGHPPFLLPCAREMLPTSMASTPRSPRRSPSFLTQARLHPAPRATGAAAATAWISRRPAMQRPWREQLVFRPAFARWPCVRMRRPSGRPTLSSATFGVEHSWTSFAPRPSHARPCSTCYSPSRAWPARMADSFLCRKPPCHAPSRQLDPRCHKALPFSLLGRSSSALS